MEQGTGTQRIDGTADAVRGTTDRVADQAASAIDSARNTVKSTVNDLSGRAHSAAEWASQKLDYAKRAPLELADSGAQYIRQRPFAVVGVAFGVGFLLGLLSSSSRSRE